MRPKVILLPITPQTHVRTTQGDKVFFRIPFDKLQPAGRRRRLRIERYNQYKEALMALWLQKRESFPTIGAGLTFFIPMPKRWSKKKRALMHNQWHEQKPDLDNLLKAFLDSLFVEDKRISQLTHLGKKWVDHPEGWIEVTVQPAPELTLRGPVDEERAQKAIAAFQRAPVEFYQPPKEETPWMPQEEAQQLSDMKQSSLPFVFSNQPMEMSSEEFRRALSEGTIQVRTKKSRRKK